MTTATRNNNPGNIRIGDPWQGLMPRAEMNPLQIEEKEFCVFQSPKYGFRAMARVLISYRDKYGIDTVGAAISRWAPPSENPTAAYIGAVCARTGFSAIEKLDFHAYAVLAPMLKAIAIQESGDWFFDERDLDAGLRLAGVEAPIGALASSRTIVAQAAAGTAAAGGGIAELLSEFKDQLSELAPYLVVAKWAMLAVMVATVIVTVYARLDDRRRAIR